MEQLDLEKKYYDNDKLWESSVFNLREQDRIKATCNMVPRDIDSLLDIGCGNGLFLNYLTQHFSDRNLKLLGVDTSEIALRYVETEKVLGSISKLPFESRSWDLVSALEVIEHLTVKEYEDGLRELARVSRKYILISVPYSQVLEDGFRECPVCRTRFNSAHHKRSFDESSVKILFKTMGFESINVVKFDEDYELRFINVLLRLYRRVRPLLIKPLSPCPVCGYVRESSAMRGKRGSVRGVISKVRRYWPKRRKSRWIIAIYQNRNTDTNDVCHE